MPNRSVVPERVRSAASVASPERLRVVSRSAQPAAVFIARLVGTAVAAYVIALWLLPVPAPVLAPLTALLVVQVSLFQTLRSAAERILSVTAGVILAVALVELLGFTWWSLGVTIAVALALGHLLRLGDHLLEVPISAMLILQLGSDTAAADRVVETLIGATVGLLAGLVASPVRVRPAEEAICDLGRSMQRVLDHMADNLETEPGAKVAADWLERSRQLSREIQDGDRALAEAEESARLNPRTRVGSAQEPGPALRAAVEDLEHASVSIRGLARSMVDRTDLVLSDRAGLGAEMWEADVRDRLACTLRELAAGTSVYAQAATTSSADDAVRLTAELEGRVSEARRRRDELGRLLREDPGHWPLHGELLVHLDRLIDGLQAAGRGPVTHRPSPRRPITRSSAVRIPTTTRRLVARRRHAATRHATSAERGSGPMRLM
ncbi:FUSC family protein [Thermomonospora umbrina]|uniref:Aromatic acid exporter family member 1 n=1 Tax=Thermomonospora umbrina TaxID=111806 RepID=A0A3D9SK18_9ACTN|nr:aromatic acid exporter family protein [Thermomonospora umbrina]REE94720.1 aromatic acid exporter family member 1 [Thermomonospora umbrina]